MWNTPDSGIAYPDRTYHLLHCRTKHFRAAGKPLLKPSSKQHGYHLPAKGLGERDHPVNSKRLMFTCLCDSQFAYLVKNEPLKTVVSIKHAFIYTVSSKMFILNEDTRKEDRLRDFWGFANNSDFIHIGVPTDYEKSEYDFKRLFNDTTRKLHIPHTSPDYSTRWDELAPGTTLNTPTKCNTSFWHILIVTNQQTVAKVWSHSRNPTNYTADMTGNRRTRKLHWPSHCYTTSEMTTRPTNQSLSFLLQSQKKSTKPLRQMPLI